MCYAGVCHGVARSPSSQCHILLHESQSSENGLKATLFQGGVGKGSADGHNCTKGCNQLACRAQGQLLVQGEDNYQKRTKIICKFTWIGLKSGSVIVLRHFRSLTLNNQDH